MISRVKALEEENKELKSEIEQLKARLEYALEANEKLLKSIYGKKSERVSHDPNQLTLFDLDDFTSVLREDAHDEVEETVVIQSYTRKKKRPSREEQLDSLPQVDEEHGLDTSHCPDCCGEYIRIGKELKSREAVYQPAQLYCVNHYQISYRCNCVKEENGNQLITKSQTPKPLLTHSMASASIVAEVAYQKIEQKVPTYRQEPYWIRLGLSVSRTELSNWLILTSEYYLEEMANLIKEELITSDHLHVDETTYNVLEAKEKTTNYMWVMVSPKHSLSPMVYYHYNDSRESAVITDLLENFEGYLQCDMYQAYPKVIGAIIVACWAHLRRKFKEVNPKQNKDKGKARQGMAYCDKLFRLEAKWENERISGEALMAKRQTELKPVMDEFFSWIKRIHYLEHSALGKAINYAKNHEEKLRNVLKDPRLVLDNNQAERAVKSLVLGRKNYLFSATRRGAKSLAVYLTLMETANRNGLDPRLYIEYLLERLPQVTSLEKSTLEAYLPWNEEVKEKCYSPFQREPRYLEEYKRSLKREKKSKESEVA